jgi:hypothetical protein
MANCFKLKEIENIEKFTVLVKRGAVQNSTETPLAAAEYT